MFVDYTDGWTYLQEILVQDMENWLSQSVTAT